MSGLSDQAIEPLEERESIEQRVAQSLRALIVAGQLPEGTQLVQRELATRLGVSQTPVRASLGRLEREGFVAVGSTGRAFVSRLTREDFEEIYAARLGLEGLAARLGAEAVGPRTSSRACGSRWSGSSEPPPTQDVDAYLALRWEFYGTCYRASGRRRLVEEVERLYWRSERYNRLVLATAQRFQESLGRYSGLLRGLRGERRARRRARRPGKPALGGRQRRGRAALREGVRVTVAVEELRDALVQALGEDGRVSDGDSERDLHAADMTFHRPQRPDLVVYPSSTEEVSRVLAVASERRVPVTPFGAGSSLEGHVIPTRGGISLDLTRMNRILEIAPEDLNATVQAGVTRMALERAAGEHGLFFPVDPGADATLGGMAATNAAGTTTIRYGKMRANILELEAVLADGTIVRTGSRARKTSAGYDLTSLLVGSEGTLAVITEVRVRLYGIPEHIVAQRISFPTVDAVCRTAAAVVAAGSAVTRLELLDAWTLAAINAYRGSSYPEGPCLLVEAAGTEATVEADLALVRELAEAEGATEIVDERDPTGRAKLWAARHDAAYAAAAASPGRHERATDTCVPVSELAGAVAFARAEVERLGIDAAIIGHAGDGNLHVSMQLDPDDAAELALADELVERLVVDALARGGTCTGEHGIGLGKIAALELEHGDLVPLMREIKRVFDPHGIMNPGKVFTS